MEKKVFFGENGLTSTSANHVANMAKEYISNIEEQLNDIVFYDTSVSLIGGESTVTGHGIGEMDVLAIPAMINTIMDAKSLCAWIREAIKEKDRLIKVINRMDIGDYMKENNIVLANEHPVRPDEWTDEDIINELSIKERNHYYELQTKAAVIGKFIHKGMPISNARQKLMDVIQNDSKVVGTGRDAMIYKYTPTVNLDSVENMFFELQKMHRSYQAEFNKLAHEISETKTKRNVELMNDYSEKLSKYNNEIEMINQKMYMWKKDKAYEVSQYKIVIPDKLKEIYERINSLGRK